MSYEAIEAASVGGLFHFESRVQFRLLALSGQSSCVYVCPLLDQSEQRWIWPAVVPSIEIGDDARFQVVDRCGDLQLPSSCEAGDQRARCGQPPGGSLGAFFGGVVDQIARVTPHRKRCRQNRLDHRANRARISRILGYDVAGRLHCAAAGVGENDDERRTEDSGAVFDGAEGRSVDEVAGIPRDKEFADAVAAEDQFWGHTAVGAANDRCPGRLVRRTALRCSARSIEQSSGWLT